MKIVNLLKTHRTEIVDIAHALTASGKSKDEVIREVVAIVDGLLPFDEMGPVGVVVDAVDGPVAFAIVKFFLSLHLGKKA
jgi:hypothetical protein